MCLVLFALNQHPDYPLILAGNRDEYHHRPAEAMHWWRDPPVLAGRDVSAGGTWLGLSAEGLFATVTNYRDPDYQRADAISRGHLVLDALTCRDSAGFGQTLEQSGGRYNGFSLIWGSVFAGLRYYSNQEGAVRLIPDGVHGLSNGLLNTPWPKLVRLRGVLEQNLADDRAHDLEALFEMMADHRPAPDDMLPETGVPRDWERLLSSPFIVSPAYGTRATSVLVVGRDGTITVGERTFDQNGACLNEQRFQW